MRLTGAGRGAASSIRLTVLLPEPSAPTRATRIRGDRGPASALAGRPCAAVTMSSPDHATCDRTPHVQPRAPHRQVRRGRTGEGETPSRTVVRRTTEPAGR